MKATVFILLVLGCTYVAISFCVSHVQAADPNCGPVKQCQIELRCSSTKPQCKNVGFQQTVNTGGFPKDAQIAQPPAECGSEESYYNYILGCILWTGGCGGMNQDNCLNPS